jgi:hypothetical protein
VAGGVAGAGAPRRNPPLWAAVELIAPTIGCAFHTSPESAKREGLSTSERKGLRAIEHEDK